MAEDQEFTLPPLEERPLVTFALFAYNQEKYIREAVEGAFAQTYEPLEIILSDDCSTDRTFEIMEEMAAGYTGPHRVITRRNKQNLGIAPHVHDVDLEATGELVVHAAGDDISMPQRTATLVKTWLGLHLSPSVLVSNAYIVDEVGNIQSALVESTHKSCRLDGKENTFYRVLGCSLAVDKRLLALFDPIDRRIIAEDTVLYRRAELVNGIFYIATPLVMWRHHSASITQSGTGGSERYLSWQLKWSQDALLRIKQSETDRKKLGLKGSSYSSKQEELLKLKIVALKDPIYTSILLFIIKAITGKVDLKETKEIMKIIALRLGVHQAK